MKVLAKTYDTMIEWMYFMQLIGKVIAPRMLYRVITMHQSKESAQKTNTLVEQQQMSTAKNVDQCSRLLTSIIDVTFVLDHLKMIQFLPMNDMSILRRLEHTFKAEHDSTYRHRFAGAIDTNVNLIKTEFCCSFSMMFSGVKNKDNFYEFVLSYVKDVLPLQYGTGQPTRDRNTFASKLRQVTRHNTSDNNEARTDEKQTMRNMVIRSCLMAVASMNDVNTIEAKQRKQFHKEMMKMYPYMKKMGKSKLPLIIDQPSLLYSPQFFLSKCEGQIGTRLAIRM